MHVLLSLIALDDMPDKDITAYDYIRKILVAEMPDKSIEVRRAALHERHTGAVCVKCITLSFQYKLDKFIIRQTLGLLGDPAFIAASGCKETCPMIQFYFYDDDS